MTAAEAKRFVIAAYVGILNRFPEESALKSCSQALRKGHLKPLQFIESIIESEEFKTNNSYVKLNELIKDNHNFEFVSGKEKKNINRIIYFCFSSNRAIGGVKVIARHAELIEKISSGGVIGELFFPETINYEINWINFVARIKKDKKFVSDRDYVIIPEMWALKYCPMMIENNIKYAIFVQNGYLIFPEDINGDASSLKLLSHVYEKSDLLFTISEDVEKCLSAAFTNLEDKYCRMTASIKSDIFYLSNKKKNLITYMPRKLPHHSSWLVNLLKMHLPEDWSISPIHGLNEKEVGQLLRESKIFLSFSSQEGLGLPPLEAAISGNYVIGYTGEAGKEYWQAPIFTEIESGNLLEYAKAVFERMGLLTIDSDNYLSETGFGDQVSRLAREFSDEKVKLHLERFLRHIEHINKNICH